MLTPDLAGSVPAQTADDEISLLALTSVLLRRRRMIIALTLFGGVVGLATGLLTTPLYSSGATFIPQSSDPGGSSALAQTAGLFGIRVPPTSGGWGPPIYVELLRSRALLEPMALDTFVVGEQRGRRVALMDLLDIKGQTAARRIERAVGVLGKIVTATEDKNLGTVKLQVTTPWPSVSLALAEQLLRGVNQFNLETRKSQAAAERRFVEVQAGEAERALRASEDRLQSFLQRNRAIAGSPELSFDRDRLQRDVAFNQQLYSSLAQNREEAKVREVRDTPVITVLEVPRLPVVPAGRNSLRKAVLGGVAAALLGVLIAFLAEAVTGARRATSTEAREFFELVAEATPKFLRKGRR